MMSEVSRYLIDGCEILFDSEMKPILDIYKWNVWHFRGKSYAHGTMIVNRKQSKLAMHRLLTGMSELFVDHINGNGLDNRRANLRLCSPAENARNASVGKKRRVYSVSPYRGVFKANSLRRPFYSQICVGRQKIYLGAYMKQESAALAYDMASFHYHGEFGRRNFSLLSLEELRVRYETLGDVSDCQALKELRESVE